MSLFVQRFSFLTQRPSITETPDRLILKTGFLSALLTLFLRIRRAEINTSEKRVTIWTRSLWFINKIEEIAFDDLWFIDYSFGSAGTDWGFSTSGHARQDQVESFSIALITKDEKAYHLCSFRGEGSACTGWSGVLLGGDSVVDFAGTQDRESKKLAEYLSGILNIPIGKPLTDMIDMDKCPACGRQTSPYKSTCIYCGASTARPTETSG